MINKDGKFIDGPSGMWCVNVGHGRKEIADAMAEQVARLGYVSPWTASTEASVYWQNASLRKRPAISTRFLFNWRVVCRRYSAALCAVLQQYEGRPEEDFHSP